MAPASTCPINTGHVDDVQEIKRGKTGTNIPPRFVKGSDENPIVSSIKVETLPVVDLSKLQKENRDDPEFQSELQKLLSFCEEWGIFQVINHGIDINLLEKTENLAMDFFNLPLEEKMKIESVPGTAQGYGQSFVFSEDQKLDWLNVLSIATDPAYVVKHDKWPTEPAEFSETFAEYAGEIREFCKIMLRYMAISLNLQENVFDNMFGEILQATRINYYPSCPRPDLVLGLSPHSDGSAITVLQERKGSPPALQLLRDEDEWVSVKISPNALVVNIGDTMEVISNGKFNSAEHRAITHKDADRLSLVTFHAPGYAVELGPMPELLNDQNPPKFRRYNHGEYGKHYVGQRLQSKKALEFAKLGYE